MFKRRYKGRKPAFRNGDKSCNLGTMIQCRVCRFSSGKTTKASITLSFLRNKLLCDIQPFPHISDSKTSLALCGAPAVWVLSRCELLTTALINSLQKLRRITDSKEVWEFIVKNPRQVKKTFLNYVQVKDSNTRWKCSEIRNPFNAIFMKQFKKILRNCIELKIFDWEKKIFHFTSITIWGNPRPALKPRKTYPSSGSRS